MTNATPSLDDIFAVMSSASFGESAARVAIPEPPQFGDVPTEFAIALNVLLDDLAFRTAALQGSQARLTALYDAGIIGIIVSTLDGRVVEINDTLLDTVGYTREEILSGTVAWRSLTPIEWLDADLKARDELRTKGVALREKEYLRKDGVRVPVIMGSRLLAGTAGEMISFVLDLTGNKRAATALRQSEARFQRLADSGIIGIAVSDVHGNIHDANDAYLRMIGYSREELLQGVVRWADLTPVEHRHFDLRAAEQLQASGAAAPWETESFRKDGSRFPVLIGVAMLEYPNAIAFIADLTERKQAEAERDRAEEALRQSEEQLRQAQKMEAVGRLAGGVAHDFNNMLSVILSYTDLILGDLRPADPLRADMQEIHQAASRAAGLTAQLLMFSRQQVVEPKVLDLHEVLTGMDRMLQRILGEDVELSLLAPKAAGRVNVDPTHVEQVIMNLVVNARDAMPTGGKITIETSNVVLDEAYALSHLPARAGPHVMMAVSDTGTGMDRATQARIFEPFFTTKEMGKGTGLGLSTVFGIVQQSGGNIWVYSELGKGTTFKVYFPRVDLELDVLRPPATPATLRGTETILLVEDEEQVRNIVLNILRRQGYRVISAQNAGEALLICENHPGSIDLLVTDVVMPHLSGPELAKRLVATRPEMRVLCMSGYTDDSIVRHGVLETGVAFLQKPVTPASLARKVREVLEAKPAVAARRASTPTLPA